jgi:hypothetical protein
MVKKPVRLMDRYFDILEHSYAPHAFPDSNGESQSGILLCSAPGSIHEPGIIFYSPLGKSKNMGTTAVYGKAGRAL